MDSHNRILRMLVYRPILTVALLALAVTGLGCGGTGASAPNAEVTSAIASDQVVTAVVGHPNLPVAARLLRSGQFLDAEIVLRAILREAPDCARAKFLLGVAVLKQKRYAQARPLLDESLASRQEFADRVQVDHFLGWSCYYLGDLDAAKRAFQSHVGHVPSAADSYFGLGVIAIDEDRIADAQQALERSLELLPGTPEGARDRSKSLARLGDCALRLDKVEDALALYEEASQLWSDHYEVWGKLARVYELKERPADAEAAREKQQAALKRTGRVPEDAVP